MLTFSKKWVKAILSGQKTVTLRKWPRPLVKVNGVYTAKTNRLAKESFAPLRVSGLKQMKVSEITDAIAKRDGYRKGEQAKEYSLKQDLPISRLLVGRI